jgi:Tfp pilus assembly protein PilN
MAAQVENLAVEARPVVERLLSLGGVTSPEGLLVFPHGAAASDLETEGLDIPGIPMEGVGPDRQSWYGAISTSLLGLRKSAFDVNLLPAVLRYRYSRLLVAPTVVLACLVALMGIALLVRAPYQTLSYADQIDREVLKVGPQVKDVSSQEAEMDKLNKRLVTLGTHVQDRDGNLESLRDLARILPPDAWLTNYSYQDAKLTITGVAASASQIQKALTDSALFKDVQMTETVTKDSTGKDRFSIRAGVAPTR